MRLTTSDFRTPILSSELTIDNDYDDKATSFVFGKPQIEILNPLRFLTEQTILLFYCLTYEKIKKRDPFPLSKFYHKIPIW